MQFLETRIIPPLVTLIFGGLMWGLTQITPAAQDPNNYGEIASKVFLGAGLIILFVSAFYFVRVKTTLNPMSPQNASSLVTVGLYKFSRNPIYLADLFFLISWHFYLPNVYGLIFLFGFIVYMNRFQIEPEERALEENFGDEYRAYKAKVPRWILFSN